MQCHYKVLNVAMDADDNEIKAAYRKLALKWHPDKNLNNIEYAKEQFQLVQQAYEILSDRQEREWYDKRREQILRGASSEFKDNSLDVYQYFTTSCFKGYSDDENGFYTVYRNVFEQIAKEDIEFMDDKEEFTQVPTFGNSSSDYETVVAPFYAHWLYYSTKKSYTWLDPYSINEMRERKIVRLAEKENKKVRVKAKKERNEEVRALVSFVRKRDKRVQEYLKHLEAKKLENQQKLEKISLQKKLERIKQLGNSGNEAEWSKFENVKSELEEIEKTLAEEFGDELSTSEQDEEEFIENLYCEACNKVFKTPKAFENHESSKKHKENVRLLRERLVYENESSELSSSTEHLEANETVEVLSNSDIDGGINNTNFVVTKQKKKKKSKNVLKVDTYDDANEISLPEQSSPVDNDFDFSSSKRNKKKTKKNTLVHKTEDTDQSNKNVTCNDEEKGKNDKQIQKQRKENKKQKSKTNDEIVDIDVNHCCVACKEKFNSKNKLFEHLKLSGHSVLLTQNVKRKKKTVSKQE